MRSRRGTRSAGSSTAGTRSEISALERRCQTATATSANDHQPLKWAGTVYTGATVVYRPHQARGVADDDRRKPRRPSLLRGGRVGPERALPRPVRRGCEGVLGGALLRTLIRIRALPDAPGRHACGCGHPEMRRRLPDGVFLCLPVPGLPSRGHALRRSRERRSPVWLRFVFVAQASMGTLPGVDL
jgi:hypothetical protein